MECAKCYEQKTQQGWIYKYNLTFCCPYCVEQYETDMPTSAVAAVQWENIQQMWERYGEEDEVKNRMDSMEEHARKKLKAVHKEINNAHARLKTLENVKAGIEETPVRVLLAPENEKLDENSMRNLVTEFNKFVKMNDPLMTFGIPMNIMAINLKTGEIHSSRYKKAIERGELEEIYRGLVERNKTDRKN